MMQQPSDHSSYLRQLGRFAAHDLASFQVLIAELDPNDRQIVAVEIQIERVAREGRLSPLEQIYTELLPSQV